ncbi:MAG: metallopeptidase TldD-related protein [Candidatus ainarchaeum sp.]|nr:metallopeptidase TldD-related protein [Candidatus ainarchaeum sp.]MDD3975809.1 metallopeptidase TldD-related protein [Candidatus ainarchaeum sp.]
MNKEEIYNYCKKLAEDKHVEIMYREINSENINFEKFDINKVENKESQRLFVRTINKGKIADTTITDISKKNILEAIRKTLKISKLKTKTLITDFGNQTSKRKIKQDKDIKDLNARDLIPEIKKNLTKEKYFKNYIGEANKINSYESYFNPYTSYKQESSYIDLSTYIVTKKNNKSSNGWHYQTFTKEKDINVKNVFNQAKFNAYNQLSPKVGKKGEYDIILTPEVNKQILSKFLLEASIGEDIKKGRSYLLDKKNKQIFSEKLSLYEEPFLDYFLGSQAIDDEGFKTSRKKIFEKGVFKKEIYDQENALKFSEKPTGNGFRNTLINQILTGHTNILQEPGKKSIEDIVSKTKKGILVYSILGMHTNKIDTGEFTLVINSGKVIENGKYKETITNLNFAGNIMDVYKNCEFSKEQKFSGSSLFSFAKLNKRKLI